MDKRVSARSVIALCSVLLAAAPAAASPQDDLENAQVQFKSVAAELHQIRQWAGTMEVYSVAKCRKYVDVMRKAGVKTITGMYLDSGKKLDSNNYEITIAQADELCDEYGRWLVVGGQYGDINFAYDKVKEGAANPEVARKCKASIAAIRATGLREDIKYDFGSPKGTLRELDKQICDALGPPGAAPAEKPKGEAAAPPPASDQTPSPASRNNGAIIANYVKTQQQLTDDIAAFKHKRLPASAECVAAVDTARKAGLKKVADNAFKPIGTAAGSTFEITIDRASQVCSDYAQYETIAKVAADLDAAQAVLTTLKPETGYSAEALQGFIDGKKCKAAADALASAKLPATLPFHIRGNGNDIDVTVGTVKEKVCDHIADLARDILKASNAADKKDTERYTKYGIAGDRLELLKKNWGFLFLPGGSSSSDVKTYASAPVIFEWTTSDPDDGGMVTHTVRRYQFSGNKLVKTTEKTYRKHKGEKVGDVFH